MHELGQALFVQCPGLGPQHRTFFDHQQGRHTADADMGGVSFEHIDIDLDHSQVLFLLSCKGLQRRKPLA